MKVQKKLWVNGDQYRALNMMRGLDQDVFYMLVAREELKDGYELSGTAEMFSSLLTDLYDDVEHGLCKKGDRRFLEQVISEISTEILDCETLF